MKTFLTRFLLVPAALVLTVATVHAQDLNAVKARIAQRLPQIDAQKASGAIGENNRGFVEARGGGADAGVVAAENADREVVYAAIAKQNGTSATVVGAARAKQIAQNSASGVWLQAETGTWYQK